MQGTYGGARDRMSAEWASGAGSVAAEAESSRRGKGPSAGPAADQEASSGLEMGEAAAAAAVGDWKHGGVAMTGEEEEEAAAAAAAAAAGILKHGGVAMAGEAAAAAGNLKHGGAAMADTSSEEAGPSWVDMLPEALAKIFARLSLEERLLLVPCVCQTWRRVSQDAVCWQVVQLQQWSATKRPEAVDRMAKMLVDRSQGFLREFSMANLSSDAILNFIAQSGPSLEVLEIPYSSVTDDCIRQIALKVPSITVLDISGCDSLSYVALEAFGEHCRAIIWLRRNTYSQILCNLHANDEEAYTIARYFPRLKHLELSYGLLSKNGLRAILDSCANLEYLDLRGCRQLEMDEALVKECRKKIKVFYEPTVKDDFYYTDEGDMDFGDYYDDSDGYSGEIWSDIGGCCSDIEGRMDMFEEDIDGTLQFWPI